MYKTRWLKVEWPLPISRVSKLLLSEQYSDTKGSGFLLSASGAKRVSGKYVEKLTTNAVHLDPFGNEVESILTSYYESHFSFGASTSLFELREPPRSIRKLIGALHSLVGLGLELSELTVDPLIWLKCFEQTYTPVLVTQISSSGIRVPKNGIAKISVSGKKDIRAEFWALVGKKKHIVESVRFIGEINDCRVAIELTKAGVARINGQVFDGLIDGVKECLEEAILCS